MDAYGGKIGPWGCRALLVVLALGILSACSAPEPAPPPKPQTPPPPPTPPAPAGWEFPFTTSETGEAWTLAAKPVLAEGRTLLFHEHVFDYAANRHTRTVIAAAANAPGEIYVSENMGATFVKAASLPEPPVQMFTTASGVHICFDTSNRLCRYDAAWQPLPVSGDPLPEYAWHGSQGIGERDGVIMFAEYWTDKTRPEGHVWRSRDDGATWERAFTAHTKAGAGEAWKLVRHLHSVQPDPFRPGDWYLSSGDAPEECHLWLGRDDGGVWLEVNAGGLPMAAAYRYTSLFFEPDRVCWATDGNMGKTGTGFVSIRRGAPVALESLPGLAVNPARNLIATDAGFVMITENKYGREVPGAGRPGVEVMVISKSGAFTRAAVLPDRNNDGFTYSKGSRHAVDGVFFTFARSSLPGNMLRWELKQSP